MNHKTLADFRVGHGPLMERLLVDGFAALLAAGVARLDRVRQDGMRVRASAGAASFRRRSTLKTCRAAAAEVSRLARELEADPGGAERAGRAVRDGKRRRGRGSDPRDDPGDGGGGGAAGGAGGRPARDARASTTDPEARVMKMADGGWRPAYNAQIVSDSGTGLIAGVDVETTGSDMGRLRPTSDALRAAYGRRPREHLVDGGFAKLDDIRTLAEAGVTVYAPPPAPRTGRDPHAPRPDDPPAIAAGRVRMGTDEAKAIYKERAATAELANAQLRGRGLVRLLVRGAAKVKAVLLLHALAHNMARLWSLRSA